MELRNVGLVLALIIVTQKSHVNLRGWAGGSGVGSIVLIYTYFTRRADSTMTGSSKDRGGKKVH